MWVLECRGVQYGHWKEPLAPLLHCSDGSRLAQAGVPCLLEGKTGTFQQKKGHAPSAYHPFRILSLDGSEQAEQSQVSGTEELR